MLRGVRVRGGVSLPTHAEGRSILAPVRVAAILRRENRGAAWRGERDGMYCVSCGAELEKGAAFCPYCGKRVASAPASADAAARSAQDEAVASAMARTRVAAAADVDADATALFSAEQRADAAQAGRAVGADGAAACPQGPVAGNARDAVPIDRRAAYAYPADPAETVAASPYAQPTVAASANGAGAGDAVDTVDTVGAGTDPFAAGEPAKSAKPSDTAPINVPLPPSIPQDGILYPGKPVQHRGAGRTALVAAGVVAVLVVAVLVGWMVASGGLFSAASDNQAMQTDNVPTADTTTLTPLKLQISAVNAEAYPTVVVDFTIAATDGAFDASVLTPADFTVSETGADGGSAMAATVERFTASGNGACRLVYSSALTGKVASGARTVSVALDELSGYAGATSTTAILVSDADNADDKDDEGKSAADVEAALSDPAGYVLPDSATHAYDASELEDYSDWELCLARNEIFARHGRGFSSADLQDYFDGKSWYSEQYTPEEFDAMSSPLSDVEAANVATIRSVEESRGSAYL